MIDRKALLADLKKQVGTLEGELRQRAADDADTHARLHGEWQKAREASRIAATYETWLDDRVTQAAVAWVLGTVFLRFCEDNGLIEMPFLAGPGDKLDLAQERQAEFIRKNPHDTDRDWILAGFTEMSRSPVAAGLFDRAHNPMWQIEIPHHAAKALLAFWRRRNEAGEIVHDFTDPEWDTRFLGDLYQDLSEHAKKTYALLQTPDFVEEFILDYTLEPAIDEFGLDGLRLIDPTCGSGHFLLGAFHRILNKWRDAEPATDIWELIRRTLLSVHGVDKNPFATNIARFRLLAAVMSAGGVSTLARAPEFPIIVATGDSLLHGRGAPGIQEDLLTEAEPHTYVTEDIYDFISAEDESQSDTIDLLGAGSYHVVIGNPPYITVKDKQENENYRSGYKSCAGTYALSVPFVERFFQLSRLGERDRIGGGYAGQITSNSFLKRSFGKKLIEEFLSKQDLTLVVDTSGAFIPGHGTPTVVLVGRRQWPKLEVPVRAIMGVRGEPSQPVNAAQGLVWQAIVSKLRGNATDEEWVTLAGLAREDLMHHPWKLAGGGAADLMKQIELASDRSLAQFICPPVGGGIRAGADEAFLRPHRVARRMKFAHATAKPMLTGDGIRDWLALAQEQIIYPYGTDLDPGALSRELWAWRVTLRARRTFQGDMEAAGLEWWQYMQHTAAPYKTPLSIVFAFVATHNHFALDRGGNVFNRHSPAIKLPEGATEEEHLQLQAILNSSTACFWLQQVSHNKGEGGGARVDAGYAAMGSEAWKNVYEFTGTKLQEFPIPDRFPTQRAKVLDELARRLADVRPSGTTRRDAPDAPGLGAARAAWRDLRSRMISEQEELDWETYFCYGLLEECLTATPDLVPRVELGQRAFEIVLARKVDRGEIETEWFSRLGAAHTTEVPQHWPEEYRRIVEKRISLIEERRDIALIERPECKRRWGAEPWEKQERTALRNWLLDRCEERRLWFTDDEYGSKQPHAVTANQLADQLRRDEGFMSVARLYKGDDVELSKVIAEIMQDEHVPHLAALRYNDPSGLRKRAQWEGVWEQQREEDRTGKRLDIPVPPRYTSADFLKPSYWRNRGKLDVPKERFISYPGSGPDGDSSMLLGWAGWDHREQAQALMMLIEERATQDGWDAARLTPLLAGLAEVLPWVRQWHGEVDPAFGQSPADAYTMYLESKQREYGISDDDLKNWRPEKPKRGGRKKRDS